jgi:hypothetical protein
MKSFSQRGKGGNNLKRKIISIVAGLCILLFAAGLFIDSPKAEAATQTEIDEAIQKGLAWLATQQNPTYGYFGSSYTLANTAAAVLAFENEGHFPGGGTAYSSVVEKALDYIFTRAYKSLINVQTVGYPERNDDPDTNGNGQGVYFYQNREAYETGMVMQAIVASNTPGRVVTTGACAGMTYEDVLTDTVDWVAWGQCDAGTGRGGWRYYPYNNGGDGPYDYSDNSVAQWPVLGLIAAEQWGIFAPEFVKFELEIWIDYIQYINEVDPPDPNHGGSGYSRPTEMINVSKTGGLLVEMYYVGDDKETPRAEAAINYINSRWNVSGPYGYWYGNKGHSYAMFSVFKGLELMEVTEIENAPAHPPDTEAKDWWGDYCEYLVNSQVDGAPGEGYWYGYTYWNGHMSTGWYIVILQATVFPVYVEVDVPECACEDEGYDVRVDYSVERFEADGTLEIYKDDNVDPEEVVVIEDFQGSATHIHTVTSDDPGTHTWKAVLDVSSNGASANVESTATVNVCETPDVGDVPDQITPFGTFDLDDYLTYGGGLPVSWSASDPGGGWTVVIDGDNVVTVTSPVGATVPVTITFSASVECCTDVICSDSDDAVFTPNRPPVAIAGPDQVVEQAYLGGADVILDGSASYDLDGNPITYSWTWPGDSAVGVSPTISLPLGATTIMLVVNDGIVDSEEPDFVIIEVVDTTPPEVSCVESVNPHGENIPGENRSDNAKSKGKNPDGFYQILAEDICDAEPEIYVGTKDNPRLFGPLTSGIVIKFTEAPGAKPSMKKIGSANGQAGAVTYHITLPADPVITVIDDAGNVTVCTDCLVPPPLK